MDRPAPVTAKPPVSCGGAVAQDRVNPGSEDSGHETRGRGLRPVADGIDAAVDLDQETGLASMAHGPIGNPGIEQLATGHVAELAVCEISDDLVWVTRSRLTS